MRRPFLLAVCCVGIFLSYLGYGWLQEALVSTEFGEAKERFREVSFALFVVFVVNLLVAVAALGSGYVVPSEVGVRERLSWVPTGRFVALAFAYSGSMESSNRALFFISYPLQVLSKCCKPLSMLVSGVVFRTRRGASYRSPSRVLSVFLVVSGVASFVYLSGVGDGRSRVGGAAADGGDGDGDGGSSSRWWVGVVLVFCSLVLDGVTGGLQDGICDHYDKSDLQRQIAPWHLMLFTNLFSSITAFIATLISGEAGTAVAFCLRHPSATAMLVAFGLCSAMGQVFIFLTIAWFSSLTCSIVTTLRKFVTILLSVVFFGHRVSVVQWIAVIGVFVGVMIEVTHGRKAQKQRPVPSKSPAIDETDELRAVKEVKG